MTQGPPVLDPEPTEAASASGPKHAASDRGDKSSQFLRKVLDAFFSPSTRTITMAIIAALLISALVVVAFDSKVQAAAGYVFARPSDFFSAVGRAFGDFFTSLVRGAFFDWQQSTVAGMLRPLTETLVRATPLIIAGLAIAVSFTGGLFNIGVQGQILMGALVGGFLGFAVDLPLGLHLLVAVAGAVVAGAVWGFIPGILRARLGANEVIVTIMLNSIALLFVDAMLKQKTFYGDGILGKSQPISKNAAYPLLLGGGFRLNLSFVVAIGAAVFVWWLLDRSTFGFEIRAAGANQDAARTAGINVKNTIMWTLVVSGALAGLAATAPVMGTERAITGGVAGTIGFDAITVALLGRSRPMGVFFAGLLFGALNAGGSTMQASAGIPVDIVQISQAVIVLMIAASEALRYRKERAALREATVKKVEQSPLTPPAPAALPGDVQNEGSKA